MSEPTPPAPPVTLAEQAAFQRLATPAGQDEIDLQESLDVAVEYVEKLCGPIVNAARTYSVRPKRHNLVLPVTRVTSVTTVTDPDGNVVVPVDVNLPAGIVELPAEPWTSKAWTVVASTGNDIKSLKLAVKIIASHLYGVHRGNGGLPANRTYPSGGGEETVNLAGFAIPRRAADLMGPYLRTGA